MEFFQILLHFDRYLDTVIANYGTMIYLLLFAIVFCETALAPLFFLPGNPLIFISGALCATGMLHVGLLMAVLFSAALIGSAVNYRIGRAIGQQAFSGNIRWFDQASLLKTHAFYENHGGVTFLLSLFIPVVRTFAPLVAGVAEMSFSRFLLFVAAGAAVWVVTLVLGGYFFGNIPLIHDHLNSIMLLGIGGGVGALVLSGLWRAYRKRRNPSAANL